MARRPQKRRRISRASSPASGTDSTCTVIRASPPVLPLDAFTLPSDLSCVSCHRALGSNTGTDAKQSQLVVCPRCRATSCSICSRACTVIPPSAPPTPLLSYSPSPPGTPLVAPAEDRELPLEFDSDETPPAGTHHALQARGGENPTRRRRRRYSEIVEDDDERTVVGCGEENSKALAVDDALPGCGRVVCKNCCVENGQTGGTTCYDCYGLPSPAHDRHSAAPLSKFSSANPSMTSLLI